MKNTTLGISLIIGLQLVAFWACDPGLETVTGSDPNTCEGCHTNEAALKKYAHTETTTGGGGG